MSERGAISPERDEIVGERGAEMSGAVCCDFEWWSGGSEHPRERGAGILTAQLRSHALLCRPIRDDTRMGDECSRACRVVILMLMLAECVQNNLLTGPDPRGPLP